jgi:hypothetical protein
MRGLLQKPGWLSDDYDLSRIDAHCDRFVLIGHRGGVARGAVSLIDDFWILLLASMCDLGQFPARRRSSGFVVHVPA